MSDQPATNVFVSDASAEAAAIVAALRERSLEVTEVPLAELATRAHAGRPHVVVVDIDADGALDAVGELRDLPDGDSIDVLFLGKEGGRLSSQEEALSHEGSGFFPRPIDVAALAKKIEALRGAAAPEDAPPDAPPAAPGISLKRLSQPPPPATAQPSPPSRLASGALSAELESLLAAADARVGPNVSDAFPPSPEEEIAAVLPDDVLQALEEPIADEEEADEPRPDTGQRPLTSAGGSGRETTGTGTRRATGVESSVAMTHDGPPGATTGREPSAPGASGGSAPSTKEASSAAAPSVPAASLFGAPPGPPAPALAPRASTLGSQELLGAMLPPVADASGKAGSVPPPAAAQTVLGPGDAAIVLAHAIGDRVTGALCVEASGGVRRIVLREGDIVTAGSGIDDDALLMFLAARGDVPREVARQLAARMPGCGKTAGAAIVAHGLLTQDQLWPTLRAHAEWLVARALLVDRGTASIEADPPGKLKSEPGVFGGATGAAVFVDVVRRVVGPDVASVALGGPLTRFASGAREALLSECALAPADAEIAASSIGRTLADVAASYADADVPPLLYALGLLGVVEVIRPEPGAAVRAPAPRDMFDAEAVRTRVRARRALVDDGDYFSLLGVSREATGYELRRAFLDLRRAFDPHRILTPDVADLADDVRTIVAVLEEAYDILRDPVRRERYRRAIEAAPA